MKHKVILDCKAEEFFDVAIQPVVQGYRDVKKKEPTEEQLSHKLKYTTSVKVGSKVTEAKITVLKYKRPTAFSMEYRSSTYHKIESVSIKDLGEQCEIILSKVEEKIKDGKVVAHTGDEKPDAIKEMGFLEKRKYAKLAKQIRENRAK